MNKYPTTKEILFDFGRALLDIEFGIIPTFWHLFVRPSVVIRDYFEAKKYFHPLKYLAVVLLLFGFLGKSRLNVISQGDSSMPELLEFISGYFPYLWTLVFSAVAMVFYRKSKMNLGEHLVMNCYLFAQALVTYLVVDLFQKSTPLLIVSMVFFTVRGYFTYIRWSFFKHIIRLIPAMVVAGAICIAILAGTLAVYFRISQPSNAEYNFELKE